MSSSPATRLRLIALAAALTGAACTRDLDIPPPSTLTLSDPFPSAAPWEQLTLSATGGTRPYHFEFAPGGNGSNGTVEEATGVYVAGPAGPAIDLVQVRDSAGRVREARITVGPPLEVATRSAFIAPGGLASFIPSGGKPPYLLEVVGGPAPGTVAGTSFEAAPSGGCGGAVSAPTSVALRLSDATGTPPIDLTVTVGRGLDIFPATGTGAVAPYEALAFVASGGQPPYQYSLREANSSGCAIDAGRGTYSAGATGNVTDLVQVTDAIGQESCFPVDVGPQLSVTLSSLDARPGKAMRILATGGRPPYAFAFAPKGNRSRGTVEQVTGEYVPGLNALATDLLLVSDATASPPVGPIRIQVGPLEVVTGDGNWGCAPSYLNADATVDAMLFGYFGSLKTVLASSTGGLPAVAEYPMTLSAQPVALDLDRDGDTDVAYLAGDGLETLLAQPGGGLIEGPRAPAVASGISGFPLAAGPGGRVFVGTIEDPTCNPSSGRVAIVAYDFDAGARAFGPVQCIAPWRPEGYLGMASGDFDGDGLDDVAYGASSIGAGNLVYWRLSSDLPAYSVEHALTLPDPWLARRFNAQEVNPWLAVQPGSYSDLVVVVIDGPTGGVFNTGLAVLAGGPTGLTLAQTRLTVPGGYNLMSVSPIGMEPGGRPQLVAANVTNGTMEFLDYAPGAATPLTLAAYQLPERPFRVGSVCGGDFDADGVGDLLVAPRSGVGASAELLSGEGDGTYARRPRFATTAGTAWTGDVDGDGLVDLVQPTVSGGLEVLFSTEGELALGPETPIDGQFLSTMVADWSADGVPDLMVRSGATGARLYPGLPARDGRFAAPQPVSVTDWTGSPAPYAASFAAAGRLGGSSAGLDVVGIERVGSVFRHVVLLFQDATHATMVYPPVTNYMSPLVFDADGDGTDDLAEAAPPRLSLVRTGDPLGAGWPFRPWVEVSTSDAWVTAGTVPVPGASPARSRGVFLGSAGFTLLEAPGGVPGAVEIAVDAALLVDAFDARVARVDGDAFPDLVLARMSGWLVFPGTADGLFEPAPRLDLSFSPGTTIAWSPASLPVPGASGQDDLIVSTGMKVVVLHNDGGGHFQ